MDKPGLPSVCKGGGCPGVMFEACMWFGELGELTVEEGEELEVKIAAGAELMGWEEEMTADFTTT